MIDATQHMALAVYITNKMYKYDFLHNRYELEDLLQIAYVQLVKAAKNFDESKGIKFSTFAGSYIKNGILRYASDDKKYNIRRNEPHNYMIYSLNYVITDEGKSTELENVLTLNNSFEEDTVNKVLLEELLKNVDSRAAEILNMYYIQGLNQVEISKQFNITQSLVSREIRRAIKKIKKAIQEPTKVTCIAHA